MSSRKIIPVDFSERQSVDEIVRDLVDLLDGARPRLDPCDPDECLGYLIRYSTYRATIIGRHVDEAMADYCDRLIAREFAHA